MGRMKNLSMWTLAAALLACIPTIVRGAALWDFNGDGKSDVASEDSVSDLGYVYLMNGSAPASSGNPYSVGDANWKIAAFADFNGDAKQDYLWANHSTGEVAIYLMNGTAISSAKIISGASSDWKINQTGDFNGDGKSDILWRKTDGNALVYLMDGTSVQSQGSIFTSDSVVKKVADFNGDGKDDILTEDSFGSGRLYLMNGTSASSQGQIYSKNSTWSIIGFGDFNGDGKEDILWQSSTGEGNIWLMDGSSSPSTGYCYTKKSGGWNIIRVGDFNGDGKDDLLWQSDSGAGIVWFMDGYNVSSHGQTYQISSGSAWAVNRLLDFNGDGKDDLLWEDSASNTVLVWLMDVFAVLSSGTVYKAGNKKIVNPQFPSYSPFMDGLYIVVDLTSGAITNLASLPSDLRSNAAYKSSKLVLRRIPKGTFTMGSPTDESGRRDNEPQHQVTLTKDYYIGVFEVTQAQYQAVMGSNPSLYKGNYRPVEYVSWNDVRGGTWPSGAPGATTFMGKLRTLTGYNFDLPTEAQWEYASRAGTITALNSGKNLTATSFCPNMAKVGRYYYNRTDGKGGYSLDTTVGSYQGNNWGLYDMHGNVYEWCLDWYQSDLGTSPVTDPVGASSDSPRVMRSGSGNSDAWRRRSANRGNDTPSLLVFNVGLRIAFAPPVQ